MKHRIPDPESSCAGKDKLNAQQAREIAARVRTRPAHAYRCDHCGSWHVGSHLVKNQDRRKGAGGKGWRV